MKILHIFSESVYAVDFIDFLRSNPVGGREHIFIIQGTGKTNIEEGIIYESNIKYWTYKKYFISANKVIFHQLNKPRLMTELLLFRRSIVKKSVWVIWGGDLYLDTRDSYKYKLIEFVRKIFVRYLSLATCYIKNDFHYMKNKYEPPLIRYLPSKYPAKIENTAGTEVKLHDPEKITIMVGNSASQNNKHLETLLNLSKFKFHNIEIVCPLSYGASSDYVSKVIEFGKATFKSKFKPILEFLTKDEFDTIVGHADILIMNQNFQMGVGTQISFLAKGKIVYLNSTTTPYSFYQENGFYVRNFDDINDMNFEEFTNLSDEQSSFNKNKIIESFSYQVVKEEWDDIFSY